MATKWRLVNAQANFERYKDRWQRLGETVLGCDHPLANADYVGPLLKHFGTDDVLLALKGPDGEDGMVLLRKTRSGVWGSFQPNTGPFTFGLIRNDETGTADSAIASLLKEIPGYPVLLSFSKLDPAHLAVRAETHRDRIQTLDYFEILRIPTDRPFEDYWSERSKNLRRNIIKKTNRLQNQNIGFSLKEITGREDVAAAVRQYGEIERQGWKGKLGTAVDADRNSGKFYIEMLERFADRGKAAIYQLRFGDEVAASAITITGCDMLIILKIAFDEEQKEYSPGLLMMYELHKLAFEMPDVKVIEYYGKATERAKQWAVTLRTLYHINYYRSPAAYSAVRFLQSLKRKIGKNSPRSEN